MNYKALLLASVLGASTVFAKPPVDLTPVRTEIRYMADRHTKQDTDMNKIGLEEYISAEKIDGVLLEGFEFGRVTPKDIKAYFRQDEEYKKRIDDVMVSFVKGLKYTFKTDPDTKYSLAGAFQWSLLQKDIKDSLDDKIKEGRSFPKFLVMDYIGNFMQQALLQHNLLLCKTKPFTNHKGKPFATVASPGRLYLDLKVPLYGIEDLKTYLSSSVKYYSRFDPDPFLKLDFIRNNPDISKPLRFIKQRRKMLESMKPAASREEKVFENIQKLPKGKYLLIFGVAHSDEFRSLAKKHPSIKFVQ